MNSENSRTKIVVTLGPASANEEVIKQMIKEGVDVFRLNFSHGSHESHLQTIRIIRSATEEMHTQVGMLADLQGPKIRIGELQGDRIMLRTGQEIMITTREIEGTQQMISVGYEAFAKDVQAGNHVLLDDGKIQLKVLETDQSENVKCKVLHGGELLPRKGVNLPDTTLSLPSLTEKDLEDVEFALQHEVSWIALSFVRRAKDIAALKAIIRNHDNPAKVIAKIEKPGALREIDEIIEISDAVMVARGDLGVEMPFDQIPLIQKDLVKRCIENAKPVIIATQMMESMVGNFRPTRAEANDVANAVLDGADALMLSAETSIGKFPLEAVRNMQKIISWTEEKGYHFHLGHKPSKEMDDYLPNSICYNAQKMAEQTQASALVTFTHSGNTVLRVASHRPRARIYAFTDDEVLFRQFSLVWGVKAFKFSMRQSSDEFFEETTSFLYENDFIQKDDIVIHIGSIPIPEKSDTNMMKISYVGG